MAVQDVVVVSVPVSDQDRAKEFYVEKLGFERTRDASNPSIRWGSSNAERGRDVTGACHLVCDDAARLSQRARAPLG
jgi:catechol 2,3-dioxygenase-like lactoylglutathione lyase family enzyme